MLCIRSAGTGPLCHVLQARFAGGIGQRLRKLARRLPSPMAKRAWTLRTLFCMNCLYQLHPVVQLLDFSVFTCVQQNDRFQNVRGIALLGIGFAIFSCLRKLLWCFESLFVLAKQFFELCLYMISHLNILNTSEYPFYAAEFLQKDTEGSVQHVG